MFIETYNIFTKSFRKVLMETQDDNIVDLILLGLNYITKLAILYYNTIIIYLINLFIYLLFCIDVIVMIVLRI